MYVFIIASATTAAQTGAQASPSASTGIVFILLLDFNNTLNRSTGPATII